MFTDAIHGKNIDIGDKGFILFLQAIGNVCALPVFMFVCVAALSVTLNVNSFLKYTPYVFIAILLYLVHNFVLKEMIQIRIGLASAICLFSIRYLKTNSFIKVIVLWIIAISIHLTAIIFGLLIILYKLKPTKKILLYAVLISLVIGTFFPLGDFVKTQIGISDKLDEYIAYGDTGYAGKLGIWKNLNTIKTLIFFCMFYRIYDSMNKENQYFYVMFLCYTIGLCWLICFNDFAIIGARMSNIMLTVEPVLLTLPLIQYKKNKFILYKSILIILSIMIFFNNITPDKITPYQFYFDHL